MISATNSMPLTIQEVSAITHAKPKSSSTSHNPIPVQSNMLGCINYDSSTRSVMISCSSASLTDINNKLHDNSVLAKQTTGSPSWLLNANIIINKGSKFYINSTDTKWLKIISDSSPIHKSVKGASSGSYHICIW